MVLAKWFSVFHSNRLIEWILLSLLLLLLFLATIRKPDEAARSSLTDFGKYVAQCLPKFVQKVQLTAGDELEVLIAPEGVVPTLQFLKDHQVLSLSIWLISLAWMYLAESIVLK